MGSPVGWDADLHMFVEPEAEPEEDRLLFFRFLVETGRLEGDTEPGEPPVAL